MRSPNKSQRTQRLKYSPTKDQRRSASNLHSPNETQCTLPRGGKYMIYSRSVLPDLVLVVVMDGRRRNDQTGPPSSPPALPTPAYACTYRLWLALSSCTYRVSVRLFHRPHQQAWIRHSFLRILGRHLLPQARALRSLKDQLIQQDCMSLDTPMRLYFYLPSQRDLQFPYSHSLQFRSLWA